MTGLNRPARLNRGLLGLFGLVLLAAGGFALGTWSGRLGLLDRTGPLVPAAPPTWAFYVAAAVAIVVGLLALRWLLAQLARKPKTHTWRFEADPDAGHPVRLGRVAGEEEIGVLGERGAVGRTEIAASTAVAPFVDEVETYPGVHSARATLAGPQSAPTLVLILHATQDGDLHTIRQHLDDEGLPRLRQALDLETLPTTIEFRFTPNTTPRVH